MTRCITVFKFLNYTRLETVSQNNALIGIGSCRRVSINSAARPLSCFQRLSTDIATTIRPSLVLHNPLFQYTPIRNAGHSKWQNIMHTKMSNDAKKQAVRSKLAFQIKSAIREGGSSDPKVNKKLADMLEIARNNQMPVENIQRILTDNKQGKDIKIVSFALKGPEQTIIIVETQTDSTNRMRQDLAALGKKRQFSVVDVAAVMYAFQHVGVILCSEYNGNPAGEAQLDAAIAHGIEAGAQDVSLRTDVEYGTVLEFTTDPAPNTFYPVISALKDLKYKIIYSQLDYVALSPVALSDAQLEVVGLVCEKISSNPDVVRLFDNIA